MLIVAKLFGMGQCFHRRPLQARQRNMREIEKGGFSLIVLVIALGIGSETLSWGATGKLDHASKPMNTFHPETCHTPGYEYLAYPSVLRSHDRLPNFYPGIGHHSGTMIEVKGDRLLGPMFRCRALDRKNEQKVLFRKTMPGHPAPDISVPPPARFSLTPVRSL